MSAPDDIHAVRSNALEGCETVTNHPAEQEIADETTVETGQPPESNESSGKSSTELLNSGEGTHELTDTHDDHGSPPSSTLVDKVTEKIRGQSMVDSAPPATEIGYPQSSGQRSHSGSEGDSSDKELSRKRKLSSRSSVATETAARQHLKRPKESDVPEKEEDSEDAGTTAPAPKSPSSGQVFGFKAFASKSSPFVSAQSSVSSTPAPASAPEPQDRTPSRTPEVQPGGEGTEFGITGGSVAILPPSTTKRPSGFAAFASASPFQSTQPPPNVNPTSPPRESLAGPVRRSKSPVGKHQAFGQYSTGLTRFGTHTARKATQDDANNQTGNGGDNDDYGRLEFEDILKAKGEHRAESDDNTKVEIQQIQYNTGEEEDFTVFQTRAKLYTQDEHFAYKERGTGLLKLNVRRSDGEGARIVMRAEGVLRLLLNMALYPGLICELGPDPKFVKVAEITPNERKLHAIKVGNAKLAQELYDHLTENTPTKSTTTSD